MKRSMVLALLGLICLSVATFGQDVTFNYDQSADFAKFRTYKWVLIEGSTQPDQLVAQQIQAALDAELAKKGLSKSDGDSVDLLVGYQVAVEQERQVNAYTTGGPGWGYGARWGGYGGMTTATSYTISIGTLVFDMYDPAAKQLVWRGRATKTLDEKAKADKRQKNLAKAVTKLLKDYPPKAK